MKCINKKLLFKKAIASINRTNIINNKSLCKRFHNDLLSEISPGIKMNITSDYKSRKILERIIKDKRNEESISSIFDTRTNSTRIKNISCNKKINNKEINILIV